MIARAWHRLFGASTLLCCVACWGDAPDAPMRPRGMQHGAAAPQPAPPPPRAEPMPLPRPLPPAPPPTAVPAPDAGQARERDYGAELLRALGSPVDCLSPRKAEKAPPDLQIDLDAYVMPSGGVGRAYARSANLDPKELDCVRRRLEALRLAAPIEDAPREVRATVRLTLKQAENQGK